MLTSNKTGCPTRRKYVVRSEISVDGCVVCPAALPAWVKADYLQRRALPAAASAALACDGLPRLYTCSPACAAQLQGSRLTLQRGVAIMPNLRRWACHLCGTDIQVGDNVDVFNSTLPGYNVTASDFPCGGVVAGKKYFDRDAPLNCELTIKPPIGGAGTKTLASGVRARSETAAVRARSETAAAPGPAPNSDAEAELRAQLDVEIARARDASARANAERQAHRSSVAAAAQMEVELDVARSRHAHRV